MAKIENMTALYKTLDKLGKDARKNNTSVTVGFTQNYALYVHENQGSAHNVGQAKYLEQPTRTLAPQFRRIIKEVVKKTGSMEKALLLVGLRLQREAQLLTPVDTGALKNSAFTCLTKDVESVAKAAYAKGETQRKRAIDQRAKKKQADAKRREAFLKKVGAKKGVKKTKAKSKPKNSKAARTKSLYKNFNSSRRNTDKL